MQSVVDYIKKYGIENCKLIIPMRPIHRTWFVSYTSSSDKAENTICEFYEDRYQIERNYKIEIRSIDPIFGRDDFYISDLNSLLREKYAKFMVYDWEINF